MNMTMRLAIEMALIHYGLPQEGVDGVEQQMEEMTDGTADPEVDVP